MNDPEPTGFDRTDDTDDREWSGIAHAHLRNKGRHGSPAAGRLLKAASDGARSEAERLLVKLLRDNGITGWKANHPVGGYKVDRGTLNLNKYGNGFRTVYFV